MKKKILMICLALIIIVIAVLLLTGKDSEEETTSTYKDVKASTMTIENTLTSSGEVTSPTKEITLNTSRTFTKIYYSVGSYIKKGTKIVKYSNGTYYKAPYNLVLVDYNLPDSGDRIRSNHYLQVKKMTTLEMSLSIDETEISKVKTGQAVDITINANEDEEYTGKISFINQIGTYSSSGSKYNATVKFTNDGNVKLGMSASVSIILEKAEDVIAVPIEAIQTENDTKYVVVVNDDKSTSNVTVETGISNSAYVEIKSGLTGEETVRMIETSTESTSNRFGKTNREDFNFSSMSEGMTPPSGNGNSSKPSRN